VARDIASQVGIREVYADLLPEDKVACIKRLSAERPWLAMVGDGVNDAPALAASRLGVAMGSGASDTALETADVVVMTPKLARLPELVRLGRRTHRLLVQNIAFALSAKGFVLALAAAGYATLWMAVAADVGASLVVIANGMRGLQSGKR
jgi:Cd2+/Zn2+-exporting ATPase